MWSFIGICLMHSFKNIKVIIPGLICYTIRNMIPLYDFEKRRSLMKPSAWTLLMMFQILVSCFNMLLLNNVMDRCFIFLGSIITIFLYIGIVMAMFTKEEIESGETPYAFSFSSSTVFVMLFMYMSKRIHKEVFMEIK